MSVDLRRLTQAERLLWGYGVIDPSQIDLEAIAFDLGAEVVYRPLVGCEARLVACGDRAIISLNANSNSGRQRFSLAHELAHWVNDRESGLYLCAKEDLEPRDNGAKLVEARANEFASQLILPNYLVDPRLKRQAATLDTASTLGAEFSTSLTAAAIKLVRRINEPACLVCHSQTNLLWHQRSTRFPSDYYLRSELNQETDAFQMAFRGMSGKSRVKTEPGDYWISHRDARRLEVTSQSIRLPNGTVLSMISA
jgi:hypothetical protein